MAMALGMWISFMFLARWVPDYWRRRAVGYGLITDITVHVILQSLFGGDAQGRVGMLLAGVLINVTMHWYRRWAGYEKLTMDGWQRFTGKGELLNTN